MHELLAIVKEATTEMKVSFGREIELILQLATEKTKSIPETTTMLVGQSKLPDQGISYLLCESYTKSEE